MFEKYMLISVCDREILTEQFKTLDEARNQMYKEMVTEGRVPKNILYLNSYDDGEYGFDEYCSYANDGVNHANYDWLIVPI